MGRKRGPQGRQRCGSQFRILPKNFAKSTDPRTNRQHRIEVPASNQFVMSRDLDLAEARSCQNAVQAVRVGEREWAGRVQVVSGLRRQMARCGRERQDVEWVLL